MKNQKTDMRLKTNDMIETYMSKMIEVHGETAIPSILFSLATIHLPVVVNKFGFFPLLMFYGKPATGKSSLAESSMCIVGETHVPVAANCNPLRRLLEILTTNGNKITQLVELEEIGKIPQVEEMLKGFWDRIGYERKSQDGKTLESVPIQGSIILESNNLPEDPALLSRLILIEFTESDFDDSKREQYRELKSYKNEILKGSALYTYYELWEKDFETEYENALLRLEGEGFSGAPYRPLANIAVLVATFSIMSKKIEFPFDWYDFKRQITKSLVLQDQLLKSAKEATNG